MSTLRWHDVPGFPGVQITRDGRIRRLARAVRYISRWGTIATRHIPQAELRPPDCGHGYLRASLAYGNGKLRSLYIHRAVALVFLPNPKALPEVNHKNVNRMDNRVRNLEWVTHHENMTHAARSGVMKTTLKPQQVRTIRRRKANTGIQCWKLAKQYDVSTSCIKAICNGTNWKHLP